MSENVVQLRKHDEPAGFQHALKLWRAFAHRRGLVVASSTRLIGGERTFFGDSDDVTFGPKDYKLINKDLLFGGELWLSKNEEKMLGEIADTLLEMTEVDIKDCRVPDSASVPPHDDERGRWDLMASASHRVGTVIRIGEGSTKHYLLYLWDGGWYRVNGQPCYDLPMFGLPDMRARPESPVMIHEGPKARLGAVGVSDERMSGTVGRLRNWMSLYVHVGWHGSDIGMEWTDWSPLRGRRVLIWPDIDEPGLSNARTLAKRLARMGGIIEYVNWSVGEIESHEGWDWADPLTGFLKNLTRTEIRERLVAVESPIDEKGAISDEWARRSFYDAERGEIYQRSSGYKPILLNNLVIGMPKGTRERIALSNVNPFLGTDYRPGIPFGRMKNGLINMCQPARREPMRSVPLVRAVYEEIVHGWLGKMIPNPRQRKHLIRRAAWAIGHPEKVPGHMIVMQGESGIGKSVFMDTLVRVVGEDRAASLFPDSILNKFNNAIAHKSVVCIHEIHSDDISRKQNASRLKELIANEIIITEEKNRPRVTHANVVHWFAATNERIPFSLEHNNDRFYFVRCVSPLTDKDRKRKDKFFRKWVPIFHDQVFLDELYAAAKWLCGGMTPAVKETMKGRAHRQSTWQYLERASLRPWEQFLFLRLEELRNAAEDEKIPLVFFGNDLVRLVQKNFPRVGEMDIRAKMNELGYKTVRNDKGRPVSKRVGSGQREPIWTNTEHASVLMNLYRERNENVKLSVLGINAATIEV